MKKILKKIKESITNRVQLERGDVLHSDIVNVLNTLNIEENQLRFILNDLINLKVNEPHLFKSYSDLPTNYGWELEKTEKKIIEVRSQISLLNRLIKNGELRRMEKKRS